jgi:putative ABC transport system permease protein
MVYANNYLIKRRKRELGLYQLLGMTRGQVSCVLALETLLASVASFIAGIVVGILASQLLLFVSASLFHDEIKQFSFMFSPTAFLLTLACFVFMFLVMLAFNLHTLRKVKLADLMGAERENESVRVRNLPVSIVSGVVGIAFIVIAYVRLDHDGLPVYGANGAMPFLITTLLMVAGTILFFFALSGLLLVVSKAVKSHYYHGLNMFTTRQLAARVNTASASMAVVCLILFLAITSVTGGMSICTVLNGEIEEHTPYDASIPFNYYSADSVSQFDSGDGVNRGVATKPVDMYQVLADSGHDVSSLVGTTGSSVQSTIYYDAEDGVAMSTFAEASGASLPRGMEDSDANTTGLQLMSVSDYNAMRSMLGMDPVDLGEDGYLITCDSGQEITDFYGKVMEKGVSITANGHVLTPRSDKVITDKSATLQDSSVLSNSGTMVVPDDVVSGLTPYQTFLNIRYGVDTNTGDAIVASVSHMQQGAFSARSTNDGYTRGYEGDVSVGLVNTYSTKTETFTDAYGITGVISYMAIYIGFVLVISCAAILAIQQLSGASDSAPRYRLLSELGCPRSMSDHSLLMQTLVYFLFPLVLALAHSTVALRSVTSVVSLFGRMDITGPAAMCGLLFVLVYGGYLLVTFLVARGVVNSRSVEARS